VPLTRAKRLAQFARRDVSTEPQDGNEIVPTDTADDATQNDLEDSPVVDLDNKLSQLEGSADRLPVQISFEIIRLFSEGLYQSPHKAIEELVSNGYDAGASNVFVLSPPSTPGPKKQATGTLWVIDDGRGMDEAGLQQLWRVAESEKANDEEVAGRKPIGQFGIGKLAAYVLAWRLTHVSKKDGKFFYTSMDFRQVHGKRQNDPDAPPVTIPIQEISEATARDLLADVEDRDTDAWAILFGEAAATSWTAAALTDFKDLFSKFRPGVLSWVLRTGLPLVTSFSVYLDGEKLVAAKEDAKVLLELPVGGADDEQAKRMSLETTATGVKIPGLNGEITGFARLYEKPISSGKSLQYGRSNGFFIRVRGRVINLEDELFGIEALNHSTWARFVLDVEAEGLREYLLSSREGVRDAEAVFTLREYLRSKFNACRSAFDKENKEKLVGLDIKMLLQGASKSVLSEPLVETVRQALAAGQQPSNYISAPVDLDPEQRQSWLADFETSLESGPFQDLEFAELGPYDRLAEYDATTRKLVINEQHPFVAKMLAHSKNQTPATLFATSEILTDGFIRVAGIDPSVSLELFSMRDRALRQIAGDFGPDPADVLRHLAVADQDKDALERAVGEAFITLGFRYERRGGNKGGPDGVLDAPLGVGPDGVDNFRVVYDAKTTAAKSVAVSKVHFDALWDFKAMEQADHAFIIAKAYDGQHDPEAAVNRRTSQGREDRPMSVMTTAQLRRLVELHYTYGITLRQVRSLFQEALTVAEIDAHLTELEKELSEAQPPVPLKRLLLGLEEEKSDLNSRPNVIAVRAKDEALKVYSPDRLRAALRAVEVIVGQRWIEVNDNYDVIMNHTATQILTELERRSQDDLKITRADSE
jgi:hypothetical protein